MPPFSTVCPRRHACPRWTSFARVHAAVRTPATGTHFRRPSRGGHGRLSVSSWPLGAMAEQATRRYFYCSALTCEYGQIPILHLYGERRGGPEGRVGLALISTQRRARLGCHRPHGDAVRRIVREKAPFLKHCHSHGPKTQEICPSPRERNGARERSLP